MVSVIADPLTCTPHQRRFRGSSFENNAQPTPRTSRTNDSITSYYSSCSVCNPARHAISPLSMRRSVRNGHGGEEEDTLADEILTNSPCSYSSASGVQAPCNSYTSPAGSAAEYTTVSDSDDPEQNGDHVVASVPRNTRVVRSPFGGVFKIPCSPMRTAKQKNSVTHSVGVTAHGSASQKQDNQSGAFHAPKVLDRKGLARRIKKFTTSLKRSKHKGAAAAPIRTLANL
jgi:hypothetical protein